jgi:hypothetical protein
LVIPASSPPTSDFSDAPICDPTLRERTVSPNTSPKTCSISYPGRSFMVEISIDGFLPVRGRRSRPASHRLSHEGGKGWPLERREIRWEA